MDDDARLRAALATLVAEAERMAAPPAIEAAVLAEFDGAHRSGVRRWIALAACIGAVALLLRLPAPAPGVAQERPFVEIPYVAPLAPYERVAVRRMEVPVSALIAVGIDPRARDLSAALPADVLVGQDGRALAF